MASAVSSSPSQHWLTVMTCNVCKRIPDDSLVYKCSFGHVFCLNCFNTLIETGPQCTCCRSRKFTAKRVSLDFLNKLKTRPGIGRPYRYPIEPPRIPSPSPSSLDMEQDEPVTLEQIFQLSHEGIQQLFEQTEKMKMIIRDMMEPFRSTKDKISDKLEDLLQDNSSMSDETIVLPKDFENENVKKKRRNVYSKQPLRCPHQPCNKIISVSFFSNHFIHDHFDLRRYQVCLENEVVVTFDPKLLEHNVSCCLGIITLYDREKPEDADSDDPKIPLDMVLIMASGSKDYILFWLLIHNSNSYKCTLALDSWDGEISLSTCCEVNSTLDSYDIPDIIERPNCLLVPCGNLENMMEFGPEANLKISLY